jgi:benzoyl-CoA reductase/2-hydroxyglutaryl-CoA dehydratase subunit BcrC/BadD/HgdB
VPEALLSVDNLFPVRLRAPGITGTETADIYLSNVTCSCTRSLLEFALDGRFDFLKGWVFTDGCDHLRRLCDNLEYLLKPPFNFILDVPHKNSVEAQRRFTDELKKFRGALSAHFNIPFTDDSIATAIEYNNSIMAELRAVGDMRKEPRPLFTGTEFHRLMMAMQAAPKKLMSGIPRLFREGAVGRGGIKPFRARVMLVGCELDDPAYTGIIEDMGGLVVADRYCTGSLPGLEPVLITGDPVASLASHILRQSTCPRMMEEHDMRAQYIMAAAREYAADGIILQSIKFCDTWGVESTTLVKSLRDAGFPVLRLEREYAPGGEGQLRTRVQTFIESMGK